MSNIRSASQSKQPDHHAVILPFKPRSHTKEQFSPCIFCGKTMRNRKFKGKTVCINCLHQIPAIFYYGS